MKKITSILIIFIAIFCLNINVFAEEIQNPNQDDDSNNLSQKGKGKWNSSYVGLRISILNSDKQLKNSQIILNKNGANGYYFCDVKKPKIFDPYEPNCWNNKATTYKTSLLPEKWYEPGTTQNLKILTFLTNNDYNVLKSILAMKDSENKNKIFNAGAGDYIIVEPMVKIDNKYGTAYDFLKFGLDTSNYNSIIQGEHALVWNTIFLAEDIPDLVYTFKGDASSKEDRLNCLKSSTCGRGMGVFYYNNLYPQGYLKINKKREKTAQPIYSPAEFTVYEGKDCKGKIIATQTTEAGSTTFRLTPGITYSYKETKQPEKYIENKKCLGNVTVNSGKTKEVTIYNTPTCQLELEEAQRRVQPYLNIAQGFNKDPYYAALTKELFILYEKYPKFNGLLNITNPTCEVVSCKSETPSFVSDCLTANTQNQDLTTFNKYNLSCYDKRLTKNEKTIGFCKNSLKLVNNLSFIETSLNNLGNKSNTKKFYSKSGGFLIRKIPWNDFPLLSIVGNEDKYGLIAYDYEKDKYVAELAPYIATATIGKTCYTFEGNNIDSEVKKLPRFDVYFGDNNTSDNIDKAEILKFDKNSNNTINIVKEEISNNVRSILKSLGMNYYSIVEKSYVEVRNYKLNKVYIEKMTGKTSTNPDEFKYYNEEVGIVTKFNNEDKEQLNENDNLLKKGIIPFYLKYDGETYNSNSCEYVVEDNIVIKDNLNIEFRIIDTNNPFNRDTNSNWCVFEDTGIENCSKDNLKVIKYIKNRPNSYGNSVEPYEGSLKHEPKYKITLTPSDIKTIRKYNKDNKYDYYELYCNSPKKCTNAFVYTLKKGILNSYENNNVKKNYGPISKLSVKGS